MQRIAINIDPVAYIRNILGGKEPDPVSTVVLGELGGAESIVCYYHDDLKTVKKRDIEILSHTVKTHLNVRVNITEEKIRDLIRMKVHMITFVAPGEKNSIEPKPIAIDNYFEQLQTYVAELQSNNIITAALIAPDLNDVKTANKLELEYIEFDASDLMTAPDMQSEMDILENISSLSLAANKLGLGVNISGGINYDNLRDIAAIQYIEDIVVGRPLFTKSVYIGFEQAVRDLLTYL